LLSQRKGLIRIASIPVPVLYICHRFKSFINNKQQCSGVDLIRLLDPDPHLYFLMGRSGSSKREISQNESRIHKTCHYKRLIRILILHLFERLDADPGPMKMNADPKHCRRITGIKQCDSSGPEFSSRAVTLVGGSLWLT
jgi:hypothetical protein